MARDDRRLRAIDLYSGVGGWSLGLRLAGVQIVASYEKWAPANETNFKNNFHKAKTVDIRQLAMADLPGNIDIVVGSPPCTQFSYSNRGGGGDIADGLKDLKRFLEIVDHLKPQFWAMENAPRVAKIIGAELLKGGVLEKFRHLTAFLTSSTWLNMVCHSVENAALPGTSISNFSNLTEVEQSLYFWGKRSDHLERKP